MVKLHHRLNLSDAVHVIVAVKRALGKLIGLHGEVHHQSIEGLLQLSQLLLWEGCEEGQHQQGLALNRGEEKSNQANSHSCSYLNR